MLVEYTLEPRKEIEDQLEELYEEEEVEIFNGEYDENGEIFNKEYYENAEVTNEEFFEDEEAQFLALNRNSHVFEHYIRN